MVSPPVLFRRCGEQGRGFPQVDGLPLEDVLNGLGEGAVLLDQLVQVLGSLWCDGEVDAGAVVLRQLLVGLLDVLVVLQAVGGQVEVVEGDDAAAELLNALDHLIGVHGLLAQEEQGEHLCGGFLHRHLEPAGRGLLLFPGSGGYRGVFFHRDIPLSCSSVKNEFSITQ